MLLFYIHVSLVFINLENVYSCIFFIHYNINNAYLLRK